MGTSLTPFHRDNPVSCEPSQANETKWITIFGRGFPKKSAKRDELQFLRAFNYNNTRIIVPNPHTIEKNLILMGWHDAYDSSMELQDAFAFNSNSRNRRKCSLWVQLQNECFVWHLILRFVYSELIVCQFMYCGVSSILGILHVGLGSDLSVWR